MQRKNMKKICALIIAATLINIFLLSMQRTALIKAGDSNTQIFIQEIKKYPDIIPTISHQKNNNNIFLTIDFSHEGMLDKEIMEYLLDMGLSIYSYRPSNISCIISRSLSPSDLKVFIKELKQINCHSADVILAYIRANFKSFESHSNTN